ncbi:MAG: helix-turn-helix domain-containing protein [Erysipelotrichaceae bacterium]|nr:helix-turn-helix domain-containing protein [Erysipelotrichaceae bacterium]
MNHYVTGKIIKDLREKNGLTQSRLAQAINVSDKTISKWETGKGLPDITLLQPLAAVLGVSVVELMNGEQIINRNIASNIKNSKFYVCPICGNIIHSMGESLISCCGVTLPILEPEDDEKAIIDSEIIESEIYVNIDHPMTKDHYLSFIAYITNDRCEIVKLYPEQNAETRFFYKGKGMIYVYCNKDGLIKRIVKK